MDIQPNESQYQIGTQLFKIVEHSGSGHFFKSVGHVPSERKRRTDFVIKIHNGNILQILVNSVTRRIVEGSIGHEFSGTLIKSNKKIPGGLTDNETEEVTGLVFF